MFEFEFIYPFNPWLAMSNPMAAAITHVVHNKQEFPLVVGVEDLLVLSVGTGQFDRLTITRR